MTFTVMTLTQTHGDAWRAMRLRGVRDFPLGFLITQDEARAMTPEKAAEVLSGGAVRGVFKGDVLVGFSGYRREGLAQTRHRAEIGPFFIAPEYQGSGAAQVLMAALLDEARADGVELVDLYVDSENHRAIRFYEKLGFVRVATLPDLVRVNAGRRDDHLYRMALQG